MSSTQIGLALWGLVGAFIYSASRLSTAAWGDQEIGPRGFRRAISQFVVALIFGPSASVAFTPIAMRAAGPGATETAVAFAIGLSVNWAWPIIVEMLIPALRRTFRVLVADLNSRLNTGE